LNDEPDRAYAEALTCPIEYRVKRTTSSPIQSLTVGRHGDAPLSEHCLCVRDILVGTAPQAPIVANLRTPVERRFLAEAVSKRTHKSRAAKARLRGRPTTASAHVGNGKATPQNLVIYCFDTASTLNGRSNLSLPDIRKLILFMQNCATGLCGDPGEGLPNVEWCNLIVGVNEAKWG
jgi:hypothetical protein